VATVTDDLKAARAKKDSPHDVLKPLEVFRIHKMCTCGGQYKPTGETALLSMPPQFVHACDKCKQVRSFKNSYPAIGYKDKAE